METRGLAATAAPVRGRGLAIAGASAPAPGQPGRTPAAPERTLSAPERTLSAPERTLSAPGLDARRARRLHERLLAWSAAPGNWRDLPWRRTRDQWKVLVAEVMLQQTQASRVVGPYGSFVAELGTPAACAGAGAAAVQRAWSGLGYNRRALSLWRTACRIVAEHGGRVPVERAALLALPGVGPSSADAVRVFAHRRHGAVVDVNVVRVVARVFGERRGAATVRSLAEALVPVGEAWRWNQAMLDLGATVCRARSPVCGACCWARLCAWRKEGFAAPDPAVVSRAKPQARFDGSDRQGRGRLVEAARSGPVRAAELAGVAGWPDDPLRVDRVADALVAEGILRRDRRGSLRLA